MKEKLFSVTLDDCDVQTKRGHGNGGQNRNTRSTAVRIVHKASGAVGESQEQRNQLQNKKTAWKRMINTADFRKWLAQRMVELDTGKTLEQTVTEMMESENLVVEGQADGKWVPIAQAR
jgi:protein subunit release factor B